MSEIRSELKSSNMKPLYKVLHDKAMEFVDESQLALMENNEVAASTFLRKAFYLEREAAFTVPDKQETSFTRYLYLRSAAHLAFQTKHIIEAVHLVYLGLEGQPPEFIKKQLQQLQNELNDAISSLQVQGLFTQANAKESSIVIENEQLKTSYSIQVSGYQMKELLQNHWFSKVEAQIKITKQGVVLLEAIHSLA